MNILVTGGTGFIGSHTIVELLNKGHNVTVVDNLVNSDKDILSRLKTITGKDIDFHELDVRSTEELASLMKQKNIDSVIHFAALKAVGESVQKPLQYYRNNIDGLLSLLEAMKNSGVNKLIFSSSATVYGDPDTVPISEEAPLKPVTNPYGATKQMAEQIIQDVCKSSDFSSVLLRYFNPIGAHSSGLIGELPKGTPNNLVPFVTQAAAGLRDKLTVYGDDYNTPDGSGVRDYIHVVDLAKAHVKSVDYLESTSDKLTTLNLGTGKGASVLEVIKTFEKVNNVKVPYVIGPRRDGDIASCYASPAKAEKLLGWKAELSLEQALKDAWKWQQNHATH
jgi:UDP-glucose 4-epimerase